MEKQSPPPAPAYKQSGDIIAACPSCGVCPDDLSFCLWLNHKKIHQALAIPGAPCAQGASEQESAFLFAEVTWKIACGAISQAVTYRDHVPSYMCEGKWRDHPFVLHRLKMSDCNKIIQQLQKMYASPAAHGPGVAAAPPPSLQDWTADVEATLAPIGELLITRGAAEFELVSELARSGAFKMDTQHASMDIAACSNYCCVFL